jgi:hypothetical protein
MELKPLPPPKPPRGFGWLNDSAFRETLENLKPNAPKPAPAPFFTGSPARRAAQFEAFRRFLCRGYELRNLVGRGRGENLYLGQGEDRLNALGLARSGLIRSENEAVILLDESVPLPATATRAELKQALLNAYLALRPDLLADPEFNPQALRVLRVCHWNPRLFLLNGNQVLTKIRPGGDTDRNGSLIPRADEYVNHLTFKTLNILPEPFFPLAEDTLIALRDAHQPGRIRVGILDTGFDHESLNLQQYRLAFQSQAQFTIQPDYLGWNFVEDSNDPFDDHFAKHGTKIAGILKDAPDVSLVPLKTHDAQGVGTLFDILCALEYVLANNIHVVNASWSYYVETPPVAVPGAPPPKPALLDKYLVRLQRRNILFVTAAGNAVDFADSGPAPKRGRNLNTTRMYPARLSRKFSNLIVVTTFTKAQPAPAVAGAGPRLEPCENYSARYVDAGVCAPTPDGRFPNPVTPAEWARINARTLGSYAVQPTTPGALETQVQEFLTQRAIANQQAIKGSSFAVPHYIRLVAGVLPQVWAKAETAAFGGIDLKSELTNLLSAHQSVMPVEPNTVRQDLVYEPS